MLGGWQAAAAADMLVKAPMAAPVYSWTGFYVGGHVGYGWGSDTVGVASNALVLTPLITIGTIPSSLNLNSKGWLGGLQFGYNFQAGKMVYGVEADVSLTDIAGNASVAKPGPLLPFAMYTTSVQQRLQWLSTLRGRVDFAAMDNLLVYATGGLALGELDYGANIRRSAFLLNYTVPASTSIAKFA